MKIFLKIFLVLGVSHLSGTLVERFAKDQPELDINPNEIECVKLAG
jgi:hypothetical protein